MLLSIKKHGLCTEVKTEINSYLNIFVVSIPLQKFKKYVIVIIQGGPKNEMIEV